MKTNYTAVTALICFSTLFSSHGFAEQDRNALENTFAKSQAGVVKSIAIQTVYSRQSSYNERITHNTSSQVNTYQDQSTEHNGFKWDNTHYTNDQASTSSTPSYTNPPRHSGYRWGTRSLSDQAGFRWGTHSFSDQAGFRWGTHSFSDQAGFRWGTHSFSDQAGFRWGTHNFSDQAGFRWGTHSFSDQAGFRWGTHSFSDQAGFRWDIKGAITAQS